jgi:hypothetical protein
MRLSRLALLGILGLLVLEVSCAAPPEVTTTASAGPKVLTQHQFITAATPTRAIFEDCSNGGPSDCASGLCIHTSASIHSDFVCTARCATDGDCATTATAASRCVSIHPSPGSSFCVPVRVATQGGTP